MNYIIFGSSLLIGALVYGWTPKEGRVALTTLLIGAFCGGILAAVSLPAIGVKFFDLWTLLGGWLLCSILLQVTMRHMNKGVEMNLLIFFGLGLFSPILAFLAVLTLIAGTATSREGEI